MVYKAKYRRDSSSVLVTASEEFSSHETAESFLKEKLASLGVTNIQNVSHLSPSKNHSWFGSVSKEYPDVPDLVGVIQAIG